MKNSLHLLRMCLRSCLRGLRGILRMDTSPPRAPRIEHPLGLRLFALPAIGVGNRLRSTLGSNYTERRCRHRGNSVRSRSKWHRVCPGPQTFANGRRGTRDSCRAGLKSSDRRSLLCWRPEETPRPLHALHPAAGLISRSSASLRSYAWCNGTNISWVTRRGGEPRQRRRADRRCRCGGGACRRYEPRNELACCRRLPYRGRRPCGWGRCYRRRRAAVLALLPGRLLAVLRDDGLQRQQR